VPGPALAGGGTFRMWDAVLRSVFELPRDLAPDAALARLTGEVSRHLLPDDADFLVHALAGGGPSRGAPDSIKPRLIRVSPQFAPCSGPIRLRQPDTARSKNTLAPQPRGQTCATPSASCSPRF
jgi:hypothetical protein